MVSGEDFPNKTNPMIGSQRVGLDCRDHLFFPEIDGIDHPQLKLIIGPCHNELPRYHW
jgi:hypothetical protein